jgi:hypothetical protein
MSSSSSSDIFDYRAKRTKSFRVHKYRNSYKVDNGGKPYIIQSPPLSMLLATGPMLASKALILRDVPASFQDFIRALEKNVAIQTGCHVCSLLNDRREMVLTLFGEETLFFDAEGTYMPVNPVSVSPQYSRCCVLLEIQGIWTSSSSSHTVGLRVKVLQLKLLHSNSTNNNVEQQQQYHFREDIQNHAYLFIADK